MPILALANGLWIGEIPDELQDLTYAEQLLITRVCYNRCIVKVSSGMFKMQVNAIVTVHKAWPSGAEKPKYAARY